MQKVDVTESAGPSKGPSQKACLPCRRVKMKCRLESSAQSCERCLRKSMNCVFEEHRRGRKPGTRLLKKGQRHSSPVAPQTQSLSDRSRWYNDTTKVHHNEPTIDPELEEENLPTNNLRPLDVVDHTSPNQSIWEGSANILPGSLDVKAGTFSLQNVLSTTTAADVQDSCTADGTASSPENLSLSNLDDPIKCKILNFPIALGLFDSFMRSLNPFVSQFDPHLHTFEYVQQKSSFLLTSILAAASRAFHPPLHTKLKAHAEKLLAKAFVQGTKSIETVQAILISTYWKDQDDSRSFLFIGYAIRICIEMDCHKLQPITAHPDGTEIETREDRNVRRTWLIIFVYDRSISLQMGKPCMIEQNNFITTSHDWYKEPCAVFGADALLCAFVSLRIISSEILESMAPYQPRKLPHNETLMRMLNANLTRWEEKWLPISEHEGVDRCQGFLICFYGSHLRLLLNSFSLQEYLNVSRAGIPKSKQAVWICYNSAIDMLKQISDKFGPLKLLYFAQDSVHMMTAYAAVFLIKMLLSLPEPVRKEFETSSIETIRATARIFASQCATQKSACALQARFLNNIAIQYENLQRSAKRVSTRPPNQERIMNAHTPNPPENPKPSAVVYTLATNEEEIQQRGLPTLQAEREQIHTDYMPTDYELEASNWTFDDNDQWEEMFANAGYNIQDGVFMPDSIMSRIEM